MNNLSICFSYVYLKGAVKKFCRIRKKQMAFKECLRSQGQGSLMEMV